MTAEYFTLVLAELDVVAMKAILAPDAAIHTPEGEFRGHDGTAAFAGTLGAAFSDLSFTTGEPTLEGDAAAVRWTMTGIHSGDYLDHEPNCSAVVVTGIAIFRFDDVQIVEQWIQYDRLALARQMEAFAAIDASTRPGCA
jgi:predicted ester cyclase